MNTFRTINVEYLRPSRTIETVIVSNKNSNKLFFVYNYEGNSFRVFANHLDLLGFFQNKNESDYHFSFENELDNFLSKVKISD